MIQKSSFQRISKCLFILCFSITGSAFAIDSMQQQLMDLHKRRIERDKESLLSDSDVEKFATARFRAQKAKLLFDNKAALDAKIAVIEAAQPGDTLRLMYYIFKNDYSSAYFTKKLVAKAQQGVKVKIFLDLISAYPSLDFMMAIQAQAPKNIEFHFYNRPSPYIVRDSFYLTSTCQTRSDVKTCSREKMAQVAAVEAQLRKEGKTWLDFKSPYTSLLLAGLYSKNGKAIGKAILEGQQIDLEELQKGNGQELSPEDKESLKELLKLYWLAKVGNFGDKISSMIKLSFAKILYPDMVNPILNKVEEIMPFNLPQSKESGRDWNHFTDYLHHKMILLEGVRSHNGRPTRYFKMVNGGRNVEDPYHVQTKTDSGKYLFNDTDLAVEYYGYEGDGNVVAWQQIAQSFDRLWNYRRMVASLSELMWQMPNDLLSPEKSRQQRISEEVAKMNENATTYLAQYRNVRLKTQHRVELVMTDSELKNAVFAYVENLPYGQSDRKMERVYLPVGGQEYKYGKNIHGIIVKGIRNGCSQQKRYLVDWLKRNPAPATTSEVILHNAYFLPPSNMIEAFGDIVDGTLPCAGFTLSIVTNSKESSDLGIVNTFAEHNMKAFAEYYQQHKSNRSADVRFYEYKPNYYGEKTSLHTKVYVMDWDLFVGSANADVRSYVMDTNNGVLVRGAPQFVSEYIGHMYSLTGGAGVLKEKTEYFENVSRDEIFATNIEDLNKMAEKYKVGEKLGKSQTVDGESTMDRVRNLYISLLEETYENSAKILRKAFSIMGDAKKDYDDQLKPL